MLVQGGKSCEVCGGALRGKATRFCSHRCYTASGVRAANLVIGAGLPIRLARAKGKIERVCERCGAHFWIWPSHAKGYATTRRRRGGRFCGQVCARNAPLPVDAKTRLQTPGWKATRQRVLARDGARCTACGSPRLLVVHHVKPWRWTRDDGPDNLVTLCRGCHARAHGWEGRFAVGSH